jgi:hypothetical protein
MSAVRLLCHRCGLHVQGTGKTTPALRRAFQTAPLPAVCRTHKCASLQLASAVSEPAPLPIPGSLPCRSSCAACAATCRASSAAVPPSAASARCAAGNAP